MHLLEWNRKLEVESWSYVIDWGKTEAPASHETVNLSKDAHTHKRQYTLSETYSHLHGVRKEFCQTCSLSLKDNSKWIYVFSLKKKTQKTQQQLMLKLGLFLVVEEGWKSGGISTGGYGSWSPGNHHMTRPLVWISIPQLAAPHRCLYSTIARWRDGGRWEQYRALVAGSECWGAITW